jgi:hypothetical protein
MHVHVENVRPDRVYKTGVIAAYPINEGPGRIASRVLANFTRFIRGQGPQVQSEMEPGEIARAAVRIASAKRQGKTFSGVVDPRLMAAADLINAGVPFTITVNGKSLIVRGRSAQYRPGR